MREYERRRRWTPWHVVAVVLILVALGACLLLVYGPTDRGPSDSVPSQVAAATATVGATPSLTASASRATSDPARPSHQPAPTNRPPAPVVTPKPLPPANDPTPVTFTPEEMTLFYSLREDAAVNCEPRRTDLPPRTYAAIECSPGTDPWSDEGWGDVPYGVAARVGVYELQSDQDAFRVYLDRMIQSGVTLRRGACYNGTPGDSSWIPGDGEMADNVAEFDGELYNLERSGCFLNENGLANLRITCGRGIYIGVLGRSGDLAALSEWSDAFAPYERPDVPSPPGLCLGPDGLVFPDSP